MRTAFAAALKALREKRGFTQHALSETITQSHISQIENEKTSPSLETIIGLADAMQLNPVALMALVYAAQEGLSAKDVLKLARTDLQSISLLNATIPLEAGSKPHPRITAATRSRMKVQALKEKGFTQAEIARELEMAESTVRRHWHRES
ncbi:helix-turn-helix domain-containing protein [Pseudomonas sp. SDO55104_S430]